MIPIRSRSGSSPRRPYSVAPDGIRLAVRLTPRAGQDELGAVVSLPDGQSAVQIRLAAAPVEGAANAGLIAFIARSLGLRKDDIAIRSGQTARVKLLHLSGDSGALAARIDQWIGTARKPPPRSP